MRDIFDLIHEVNDCWAICPYSQVNCSPLMPGQLYLLTFEAAILKGLYFLTGCDGLFASLDLGGSQAGEAGDVGDSRLISTVALGWRPGLANCATHT